MNFILHWVSGMLILLLALPGAIFFGEIGAVLPILAGVTICFYSAHKEYLADVEELEALEKKLMSKH